MASFIDENDLQHGDLVNFGEFRESETFIVCRNDDEETMSLERNPDDMSAGYLTIPYKILKNVTDAMAKYDGILKYMEEINHAINLNISSMDKFIRKKLKSTEQGFVFDVNFDAPELCEGFAVRKEDEKEWKSFKWDTATWAKIKREFEGNEPELSFFNVKALLQGEDLAAYQTKQAKKNNKYAWRMAVPKLPEDWELEKGQTMAGAKKSAFVWKLQGPKETEEAAKDKIKEFFGDVPYDVVPKTDVNLKLS